MSKDKRAYKAMSLDRLEGLDRQALVILWQELFKTHPPKRLRLELIKLALSFEIQKAHMSKADKQALFSHQGKLKRQSKSGPKAGSELLREWGGVLHRVEVREDGYIFQQRSYRSLSAIAEAITGTHWSGPRFFGLNKRTITCTTQQKAKYEQQA